MGSEMCIRDRFLRFTLIFYAAGATFYANFYSAELCVGLTALCFMLAGEVFIGAIRSI